jgi:hypothetical protein
MFKEQLEEVADSSSLLRANNGKLEVRVAELTTTKVYKRSISISVSIVYA